MKALLVAMIVPVALLISFRQPNGNFELADFERFAHDTTPSTVVYIPVTRSLVRGKLAPIVECVPQSYRKF